MIKTIKKKIFYLKHIALALTISFSALIIPDVSAYASEQNNISKTNKLIEKTTEMNNVLDNTKSSNQFIAISDGENSTIEVPKNPSLPIKINSSYNSDNFSINLPKEINNSNIYKKENGNILYLNKENDNSFATQVLDENGIQGIRSLITINNANAQKEYKYKFNLENGSKLVKDSDYLGNEFSSGEIFIVNKDNIITGIIDKPWAYDSNRKKIDTFYKIEGNNLIQVINFKPTDAFPIVADPSAWQITKCVGSLAWAIGSTVFIGAKLLKIKRYIKALGGLRQTAQLLLGATTLKEKFNAGGSALVKLSEELLGIAEVKENCFP